MSDAGTFHWLPGAARRHRTADRPTPGHADTSGSAWRGALTLVITYANAIAESMPLAPPELQRLAVTHIYHLVAATISTTRDGRVIAELFAANRPMALAAKSREPSGFRDLPRGPTVR